MSSMPLLKLNVGSFTVMFKHGWLNLDGICNPGLHTYAAQGGYQFMPLDCSFPLPFPDSSTSHMFVSHFFEHVPFRVGEKLITDWKRVLIPGGVIRIAVPDLDKICRLYVQGGLKEFNKINEPCKNSRYDSERLWEILTREHQACYDFEALKQIGEENGLVVTRSAYKQGTQIFIDECKDVYPEVSLYVEMQKP